MGKLDIGVGDDFPVDEPAPPSAEVQEAARAAREEWEHQKEEWHRRKDEWRAQRRAWRDEMRARRDTFKSDLKRSLDENFGPRAFPRYNGIFMRIAVVLGILALAAALLPFLLMFGLVALAAFLFFTAGRGRHGDSSHPHTSQ